MKNDWFLIQLIPQVKAISFFFWIGNHDDYDIGWSGGLFQIRRVDLLWFDLLLLCDANDHRFRRHGGTPAGQCPDRQARVRGVRSHFHPVWIGHCCRLPQSPRFAARHAKHGRRTKGRSCRCQGIYLKRICGGGDSLTERLQLVIDWIGRARSCPSRRGRDHSQRIDSVRPNPAGARRWWSRRFAHRFRRFQISMQLLLPSGAQSLLPLPLDGRPGKTKQGPQGPEGWRGRRSRVLVRPRIRFHGWAQLRRVE